MNIKMQKKYTSILLVVVPLLLAVACIGAVIARNNQAALGIPIPLEISGEYSYDGTNWLPLEKDSSISALDGELIVRGHLSMDCGESARVNYYRNHIGVSVYANGELVFVDSQTQMGKDGEQLPDSMCGKEWNYFLSPGISAEDEVEIHLVNYHRFGNKSAYREMLDTMCLTPNSSEVLGSSLKKYQNPYWLLGGALVVLAILLLGAAVSSFIWNGKLGGRLFYYGFLTLFAGGFIIFDTIAIFSQTELVAVHSYGWQLCMIFFTYILGMLVQDSLTDRLQKIAQVAMAVSGLLNCVCIILAMLGRMLLYDTLPVWMLSQWVLSVLLLVCCLLGTRRGTKRNGLVLISYASLLLTVMLDLAGVGASMYSHGTCTKVVFVLLCIVYLIYMARMILMDHSASVRAEKLEAELAEKRTKIVLSQIQQHFVYNCLAVIRVLCKKDPELAAEAVMRFSNFLRGTMDALDKKDLVPLEDEFYIVNNYLYMEKLRFQDKLHVEKNIEAEGFCLPALTIQPIVENAIKHGLRQKPGEGTVWIHTYETDTEYVVAVSDDGVGFEVEHIYEDGGSHIGIKNVDERLRAMCDGYLEMHSVPGEGSQFYLHIPKKGV